MITVHSVVSKTCNGPSLIQGHDYYVVEIDPVHFRVVDEIGDPVLYPKDYFSEWEEVRIPDDWVFVDFGDGSYVASPSEFSAKRFFDDFFDGHEYARGAIKDYCQRASDRPHTKPIDLGTRPVE